MKELEGKEFLPTPKQIRFANLYLDVNNATLTQAQLAKEAGISPRSACYWLADNKFRSWLNSQRKLLLDSSLIHIYRAAIKKALRGDSVCIRLILEMSGDYQPGMRVTGQEPSNIKIEVVNSLEQPKPIKDTDIEVIDIEGGS